MPTPREVYDHPDTHWLFLTASSDDAFEGQYFDRKEAGRPGPDGATTNSQVKNTITHVKETVSAFANANREGGLLVLGISSDGKIKGTKHLREEQRNSVTDFNSFLVNQVAQLKFYDCGDETGAPNQIILIYTPQAERAICETIGRTPEAWIRRGSQNITLTQPLRDSLRREKRIVDYENTYCCDFDISDVDLDVLAIFRRSYLQDITVSISDTELLYQAGAIIKKEGGGYAFNNAGLLFFATNPQRILAHACVRLIRFDTTSENRSARGLDNFRKIFTGPLTKQIRETRTYFRESGFFKNYQKRRPGGGFLDEPEYPALAIDEAIVNAIAHRDYAVGLPIECEAYRDAFWVINPGRIIQPEVTLPDAFSLSERILDSMPRNSKLLSWLTIMKDAAGRSFVQAIGEGTKQMTKAMLELDLPAPIFYLTESQTRLKLANLAEKREAELRAAYLPALTEFINLYAVRIQRNAPAAEVQLPFQSYYGDVLKALSEALVGQDWYIDGLHFSRLLVHRRHSTIDIPQAARPILRLYPAYELQLKEYYGHVYLCIDYTLVVLNVQTLDRLLRVFTARDFVDHGCVAHKGSWREGRVLAMGNEWAKIRFYDDNSENQLPLPAIIPKCTTRMLEVLLKRARIPFDLHQAIKLHSLASHPAAARERIEKIAAVAEYLADSVFPVSFGDFVVELEKHPVQLTEFGSPTSGSLPVRRLTEPAVVFREQRVSTDVRSGITQFGAYDDKSHQIELIPICTLPFRDKMAQLIERLQVGKYKYRGSERTFSTSFTYQTIITVPNPGATFKEVGRLIHEHPDWIGSKTLRRLFLVHTPEQGNALDDESTPYYTVKRLLLENGIPCQMVDSPTLADPDWKDLNLALNITAKCGITPWVLPDAIPEADFFVGLSYTQSRDGQRVMGFANVFNKYGKWEFYSGNTAFFDYMKRAEGFSKLTQTTLERLKLSQTPNIVFHYSAKFSHDDRNAILEAARNVRPEGVFSFGWINSHHNIRGFDARPDTDGSLRRGSYVQTAPNQIYISTTGDNPFRKALGTPMPLEINTWTYRPSAQPHAEPDMRSSAVQILSLTKLNWASTDSFCGEPITIKYAKSIAYLTAAFLRQSEPFQLHEALERTAWFL